ncbi:probable glycosyltransferase At3g07620 isoform X1 [Arachis ipaensis]|uniref:probable glycosyltransferase At3g07620 isoform X1 n=1 Tax=Arachis ipaensis TaxID=130454 RepID=UPI0007AFCE4D|nr:probable glycosyltransferase At3g07620 isoform X1 [Arachis ipaensis]
MKMGVMSILDRRLYHLATMRFLFVGVLVAIVVVFQCFALPSWRLHSLLDSEKFSVALPAKDMGNGVDLDYELESNVDGNLSIGETLDSSYGGENSEDAIQKGFTHERPNYAHDPVEYRYNASPLGVPSKGITFLDEDLGTLITARKSSNGSGMQRGEMKAQNEKSPLSKVPLSNLSTSLTRMNSLLLQSFNSSYMRPRWSSRPDRELLSAKLEIENGRVVSNPSGLHPPIFRDVAKFSRSYALMERRLKVYVYREGDKPIFHQPRTRGLYASEGWFMKLMEGNKRFVVKDPRRAHLFYLPFSSQKLRVTLAEQKLNGKQMEQYLERYVHLIAGRYRFWNRTGGADHFLVACHDWASQITRQPMKNCIRSLCNSNIAKGFQIGKDTTLPVTYIHSMMDPLRGFTGKSPSERSILAFFAGSMHGYLRPVLLKHWENKESDMKIFGPMGRDIEGKKLYMEYMNSSKYCICARGYEVHTPRIVEAIFSECVPVIISDNYVPPFFEVLNWEAFSVTVSERDIPNLREILVSIPEEKYLALHLGVKKVQQHFLWHRIPVKYDLFHMILHAIWNNRLSQIRPR